MILALLCIIKVFYSLFLNLKFQQYDTGTIIQEPIKANIAIASTFTSPDVEYLDKTPITPIIESITIIAPKDIDAGPIIFFMFNLLSSVVCFFLLGIKFL